MAVRCPRSVVELAAVPGIGAAKLARYGKAFLEVINGHDMRAGENILTDQAQPPPSPGSR